MWLSHSPVSRNKTARCSARTAGVMQPAPSLEEQHHSDVVYRGAETPEEQTQRSRAGGGGAGGLKLHVPASDIVKKRRVGKGMCQWGTFCLANPRR